VRLPLLLHGWRLANLHDAQPCAAATTAPEPCERGSVDTAHAQKPWQAAIAAAGHVGWDAARLGDTSVHFTRSYEPVLVLTPGPELPPLSAAGTGKDSSACSHAGANGMLQDRDSAQAALQVDSSGAITSSCSENEGVGVKEACPRTARNAAAAYDTLLRS
jgi:hypothetical protein